MWVNSHVMVIQITLHWEMILQISEPVKQISLENWNKSSYISTM